MRTNHRPQRPEGAMFSGPGRPGPRRSFLAASGLGAAALLASGLRVPARAALVDDPWAQADAIVARIGASEPTFPDEDFPITDYAAAGLAAGTFLTGAVHLLSNVNLYL